MKKVLLATVVAFGFASTASAADLSWFGTAEYAVEAQTVETVAGVDVAFGALTVTPALTLNDVAGSFDFDSADLTVGYDVSDKLNAYVRIEADADFKYSDAAIGVALRF